MLCQSSPTNESNVTIRSTCVCLLTFCLFENIFCILPANNLFYKTQVSKNQLKMQRFPIEQPILKYLLSTERTKHIFAGKHSSLVLLIKIVCLFERWTTLVRWKKVFIVLTCCFCCFFFCLLVKRNKQRLTIQPQIHSF